MNSPTLHLLQAGKLPTQDIIFIRSGKDLPLVLHGYYDNPSTTVVVSLYESPSYDMRDSWWVVSGGLSKYDSARLFLERFPIFLSTNQVAFFDPDIALDWGDLTRLFKNGQRANCDLYQASLSHDSHCSWPFLFKSNSHFLWRKVSFVEVMAPIFKTSFLKRVFTLFSESISTWGLEYIWYRNSRNPFLVCDHIFMTHVNPVNLDEGKFYSYLSSLGINPWHEKEVLRSKYIQLPYYEGELPRWLPWQVNNTYFFFRNMLSRLCHFFSISPSSCSSI